MTDDEGGGSRTGAAAFGVPVEDGEPPEWLCKADFYSRGPLPPAPSPRKLRGERGRRPLHGAKIYGGAGVFAPDHIGPGWVLGRQVDADGTERVRLYRLER